MGRRVERIDALDERGAPCKLVRVVTTISTSSHDGAGEIDGLASVSTPDGEQCTPDGPGAFRAIHSGRTFTLA